MIILRGPGGVTQRRHERASSGVLHPVEYMFYVLLNICLSFLHPKTPKYGNEGIKKALIHKDNSKRKVQ